MSKPREVWVVSKETLYPTFADGSNHMIWGVYDSQELADSVVENCKSQHSYANADADFCNCCKPGVGFSVAQEEVQD